MDDNFERGKKKVIDNALDVLERLTGLSDSSLDAIREAIEGQSELYCLDKQDRKAISVALISLRHDRFAMKPLSPTELDALNDHINARFEQATGEEEA